MFLKIRPKPGKSLSALIITLLIVILFAGGCGTQEETTNLPKDTRIIVDCIGREVEIPANVESAACLYAFAGHVTALLGEEDKISAVVNGLKRDQLLTKMFPTILAKAVPYTEGTINIEELAKVNPDVAFIRVATYKNKGEMDKLEAFQIPAVVVDSNTIAEQRKAVQVIGDVFGGKAKEKAKLYDQFYIKAMNIAKQKASQVKTDEKVSVFHSVNEATRTDPAGTLSAEWMELVGVDCVSANKELKALEGKMYASLEQIYLWDPDVIICNEPGVPTYILTDPKWAEIGAVRNKKVHQMPVAVSRWGHPGSMETPLAIYWLGKLVYPEIYSDISVEDETKYFYKTFFDYALTEDDLQGILSGEGMRLEKGK